jgi:hypothetical protein
MTNTPVASASSARVDDAAFLPRIPRIFTNFPAFSVLVNDIMNTSAVPTSAAKVDYEAFCHEFHQFSRIITLFSCQFVKFVAEKKFNILLTITIFPPFRGNS